MRTLYPFRKVWSALVGGLQGWSMHSECSGSVSVMFATDQEALGVNPRPACDPANAFIE